MKKLVALLLMLSMLVPAAAGSAEDGEKIQLVGMCWGSTAQYEQQVAELMEANPELAEKYEVTWVLGGEGDGDCAEKIRLGLSANEYMCDFSVLNYTQLPEFARAGVLADLTDAIAPYQETMTEAAKTLSQYEGQTLAVPFEVKTKVWFYRSDIFEECGVDVESITDTDSFIAAGKKIQETYPDSYMWNFGSNTSPYVFYLTLSGNGASFFDENGNYNIASDPGTRAMLEDYKKMVEDARTLDCDMFRIGMMPMNAIGSFQKCVDFAKQAEEYALKLKEDGIDLYYHNHHIEFMKVEGQYLLDIIRANAPHLGFELDTHWIQRGGENPVKFIEKYAGSVRLLHLKDYRIAEVKMPDMSGGMDMKAFAKAFFSDPVQFAELGQGNLPLKACIEAGLAGGAEYFLIEQDDAYGRDPFDCLRDSRDHLISLGYADWF